MDRAYAIAEYISDTVRMPVGFTRSGAGRFGDRIRSVENQTGNTFTAVPLKAGEIKGVFTSVTLTSGKVVAYKI